MHLLLIALSAPSLAATWTVEGDGTGDFSTLAAAASAAANGDEIALGIGAFAGGVDLGAKTLSIVGTGANSTVVEGTGTTVFSSSGTVSISGVTVTNGGQAFSVSGGTLTLTEVLLSDVGSGETDGGAVVVTSGALVINDSELDGGQARYGMINMAAGTELWISGSSFQAAEANWGGAIYATDTTIIIEDSHFEDLYAQRAGGAIYMDGGSLEATDTDFFGNLTDAGSGSAIFAADASLDFNGGSFELNYCISYIDGYSGGAVYVERSSLTARATTFSGNWSYYGGGVRGTASDLSFDQVQFSSNWSYYGGGVYLDAVSSMVDSDSTWSSNTGYSGGGALYAYNQATVSVQGSTFSGNDGTYGYGGAVYLYYYTESDWTDVTFQDNYAYYGGGGVMSNSAYGTDTYTRCSFDGNESYYYGGGGIRAHYYANQVITDSTFTSNESELDHGGGIYLIYSGAQIEGTTFNANRSLEGMGGGLYSYYAGGNGAAVVVQDSTFSSNEAKYHGGGVASQYDRLVLADNVFHVNDTGSTGMGGAVFVADLDSMTVERNVFSGNNAGYGGAAYDNQAGSPGATWRNNVFVENTADIGGALIFAENPLATLVNNTFVGNSSVDVAGNLGLVNSNVEVVNNSFAHSTAGVAVYAWDADSVQGSSFANNAFFDITDGLVGGELVASDLTTASVLDLDPAFAAYSADGDNDNDNFVLLRDSPLIDAGFAKILDPDDSQSDIGAWGGPHITIMDSDEDGYDSWIDCEDQVAAAHPGGTEVWYDGINGDCLSGSDYDADSDGEDAEDFGGTDCDDTDPAVQTDCDDGTDGGATDGGADGGQAGDGGRPADDGGVGGGCGCATPAGLPGGVVALTLALFGLVRRRD